MNILILILASVLSALPPLPSNVTVFNGIVKDTTGTPVPTGNVTFTLKPGIDSTTSGNARFTPTSVSCQIETPPLTAYTGNGTTTTVTVGSAQVWQIGDVLIVTGTGSGLDTTAAATYTITATAAGNTQFSFPSSFNGSGTAGFVGGIFSPSGTGPCTVLQNSAINPAYTSYAVAIQPAGTTTSSFNTYAIGSGPIDISTIVPTPSQQPSYSFVDLFSNGQLISGQKTFTNPSNVFSGGTFNSPILNNATFNGTTATAWTLNGPTINGGSFNAPIQLLSTNPGVISWANFSGPRSLIIPDPGTTDTFVFANFAQTLNNKTIGGGTFAGIPTFVNGYTPVGGIGFNTTTQTLVKDAQGGIIGTTPWFTFANTSAQAYVTLNYRVIVQSTGVGTNVALSFIFTDCVTNASTTVATGNLSLTSANVQIQGGFQICPASNTTISYAMGDTAPGTGTYSLRAWAVIQ